MGRGFNCLSLSMGDLGLDKDLFFWWSSEVLGLDFMGDDKSDILELYPVGTPTAEEFDDEGTDEADSLDQ